VTKTSNHLKVDKPLLQMLGLVYKTQKTYLLKMTTECREMRWQRLRRHTHGEVAVAVGFILWFSFAAEYPPLYHAHLNFLLHTMNHIAKPHVVTTVCIDVGKMGICRSRLTAEQNQELGQSKLIDRKMREEAEREAAKIKLLLLGTGESGKSTLFKQMRILYGNGFSSDDCGRYKWHIWSNIIECMRSGLVTVRTGPLTVNSLRCRRVIWISELDFKS
jgi:hypothetical protein